MLFADKISEVTATIANISQEIEDLQARIEALRIEKLELEQYQQQLGSAENASESAIEQVKTALAIDLLHKSRKNRIK
jgi:prefoldin subunit 5